jgi:hypothetical protein
LLPFGKSILTSSLFQREGQFPSLEKMAPRNSRFSGVLAGASGDFFNNVYSIMRPLIDNGKYEKLSYGSTQE